MRKSIFGRGSADSDPTRASEPGQPSESEAPLSDSLQPNTDSGDLAQVPGAAGGGEENGRRRQRHSGHPVEAKTEEKPKRKLHWSLDLLGILATALILSALIKAFVVQPFSIPSDSMENTLIKGDKILVSKMGETLTPLRRGDVVVFADQDGWLPASLKGEAPSGFAASALGQGVDKALRIFGLRPESADGYLVKRLIGLPGDHVVCCTEDGLITVNGKEIKEPYLKPTADRIPYAFDVVVPPGKIWVEGDNRNNSSDSRYHQDEASKGFIDLSNVVGRALARYYPLDRVSTLPNPGSFDQVPGPKNAGEAQEKSSSTGQ